MEPQWKKTGVRALCGAALIIGTALAFPSAAAAWTAADDEMSASTAETGEAQKNLSPERDGHGKGLDLGLDFSKYSGMAPEEARAALLADVKAALDVKVAEGTLTREKADAICKRIEEMPGHGRRGCDCDGKRGRGRERKAERPTPSG